MEKNQISQLHIHFESAAQKEGNIEFWFARDLQKLLGYEKWENFAQAIERAKISCVGSKQNISDHFPDVRKMIGAGKGAKREVSDLRLTRYACYLIAQNGDSRKTEIAFAQTYFAVQTRKQEIIEKRMSEIERLQAREKLSLSEKELSGILFERGVDGQGFARIRSKGDKALFGGCSTQDMKYILHVPNILRKENIIPENLPPAEDIKKLNRKIKSDSKKLIEQQ